MIPKCHGEAESSEPSLEESCNHEVRSREQTRVGASTRALECTHSSQVPLNTYDNITMPGQAQTGHSPPMGYSLVSYGRFSCRSYKHHDAVEGVDNLASPKSFTMALGRVCRLCEFATRMLRGAMSQCMIPWSCK